MTSQTTTYINPVVGFKFRIFHFRDESTNMEQKQQIHCTLYLEENMSTYEERPCECYTPEECGAETRGPNNHQVI